MFWMKGGKGTPMSYASDGVPAPPYTTQLAVNLDANNIITLDLFDVSFSTGVKAPKHKWFNVAVSWSKTFGKLTLYINGEKKWEKNTHSVSPAKGKPAFSKAEFVPSGCFMLGHKAKRPCKQRVVESSFKGE